MQGGSVLGSAIYVSFKASMLQARNALLTAAEKKSSITELCVGFWESEVS